MLWIFFTEDFWVDDLLCGAPSCSEVCLFFSNDLVGLRLQSVHYDLQRGFAGVADEADREFWVWLCCRLPYLESVIIKDCVQGVGHSPVCQVFLLLLLER